jgi:hypothetical protein
MQLEAGSVPEPHKLNPNKGDQIMKSFGNVCYAMGIIVAITVVLNAVTTGEVRNVFGSVDCDTPGLYTKNDDCRSSSKPNKTCIKSKQRCKATENGVQKLCKPGEGGNACTGDSTNCYLSNDDDTSDQCGGG